MNRSMKEIAEDMKEHAPEAAAAGLSMKNRALESVARALKEKKEQIFEENRKDLERASREGISPQVIKRLRFDEAKLSDVCAGIRQMICLEDPVGRVLLERELDEGLLLKKVSCPIGLIGVIFEARPDALVQISALCIKSGNAAILKGGKETACTNRILFDIIHEAVTGEGMPVDSLYLAQSHSEIDELLECEGIVDLLIPRGSNGFVQYIMNHTNIPVMGHADGVCHVYVDSVCDQEMALDVICDAKTQYPVACNAAETVLVARNIAGDFLPKLKKRMEDAKVALYGTEEAASWTGCQVMGENDFHREYGDLSLSLKLVEDVKEAVSHINRFGSHHTDAIITDDDNAAQYFQQMVDSAGVYRNCSTRFADGFRYGFGAEVGISTGKLHARGPVGLEGLTTYKYEITGTGHIVGDYASGKKSFHFRDLG